MLLPDASEVPGAAPMTAGQAEAALLPSRKLGLGLDRVAAMLSIRDVECDPRVGRERKKRTHRLERSPVVGCRRRAPSATEAHASEDTPMRPRAGPDSRDLPTANKNPGDDLFSQGVAPRVSSALESLTSVFGMGTGGSSPLASPGFVFNCRPCTVVATVPEGSEDF